MTTFFRSLPILALAAWIVYGLWRLFEWGMKERLSPTIRLYGRLIPAFLLILPTPWLKPAGKPLSHLPAVPAAPALPASPVKILMELPERSEPIRSLLPAAEILWLSIACCLASVFLIRGFLLIQRFRKGARPDPDAARILKGMAKTRRIPEVSRTDRISTPLLTGLLRPIILLPEHPFSPADLTLILTHEYTHYRYRDLFLKLFLLLTACVQWFNPLGWLLVRESGFLCEEACDWRITRHLDREERRRYGRILLETMDHCPEGGFSAALSDSGRLIEKRLKKMLHASPMKKRFVALAAAAVLALCGAGTVLAVSLSPNAPAVTPSAPETTPEAPSGPPSVPSSGPEKAPDVEPPAKAAADPSKTSSEVAAGSSKTSSEVAADPSKTSSEVAAGSSKTSSEVAAGSSKTSSEVAADPSKAPSKASANFAEASLLWPLSGMIHVTAAYQAGSHGHAGLDLTADAKDAPILASADGVVETAEYDPQKGWYLEIRHENGLSTLYSACRELLVSAGDAVSAGDTVAILGSSGYSTGPHCHFEVLENGAPVDPLLFLPQE